MGEEGGTVVPIQGSREWIEQRLGMVTGSRFADVMTGGKTAQSYMTDLVGERLTGIPSDEIQSKYLRWGNKHEPEARQYYAFGIDEETQLCGFIRHPKHRWVGCSPDSFVGGHGINEIKCPYTPKQHIRTILSRDVPREYIWQVYGNLWVTGRQWCDFVSYHPRFPEGMKIVSFRVQRDDSLIRDLEKKVVEFCEDLERRVKLVKEACGVKLD